jgi:cleavage and polyadenylation specificity factor subunit 1
VQVVRPLNQVLSSMADQELGLHTENDVIVGDDLQKVYTVDEFEVRIMELEKASGRWKSGATIPMQPFENALTVRIVTLQVCIFSSWILHSAKILLTTIFLIFTSEHNHTAK